MKSNSRFPSLFSLALILAIIATLLGPATSARAAALVVNSLNDVDDGTCDTTHCSLREAINEANTLGGSNTITFSVSGTIHLTAMLPIVASTLGIDGGSNIIVSGDTNGDNVGDVVILQISTSQALTLQNIVLTYGNDTTNGGGAIQNNGGTVTIQNSTISNSTTTAASQGGGGILNNGGNAALTITDSTITANTATFYGGGIANVGGTVTISNSVLSNNNSSTDSGGAIFNMGTLLVSGSTFKSNQANTLGGGAIFNNTGNATVTDSSFTANQAKFGGAIYTSSTLAVTGSTFSKNIASDSAATGDGGGIYIAGSGSLTVKNSTFSGNTSLSRGGGIFSFGPAGLTNVTLSGNSAGAGNGAGIHTFDTLALKNTIIANSTVSGDCVLDAGGSVTAGSKNNLIEDALNSCGLTNAVSGNIVGSDPKLGPLANHGGPTLTHNLLPASPAINAGVNLGCPAADQRGVNRPQGSKCDIGAYEIKQSKMTFQSNGAEDGSILETGENSNMGGTMNSVATLRLGDDAVRRQYRSILSFGTAGLPDNATIFKVTLKVRQQGITGPGNPAAIFGGFVSDIRKGTFGAPVLQPADWQAPANTTVGPLVAAPVGGWFSLDLTPGKNQINKLASNNGLTQIRIRFMLDDNNDAVANFLSLFSGNAVAASRPQLIIEYYIP